MPLTDITIRSAKPGEKPIRMFDADGLYLEISTAGGKLWRFKYRFGGKEKRLSFGIYPDISLAKARELTGEARRLLANDTDPGEVKKSLRNARAERAAHSLEAKRDKR